MPITTIALATAVLLQRPAAGARKPDVTLMKANLGGCTADFTVKDTDGKPVYAAMIHVKVRYGFWSIKRADLEVGTNSDGKARIEGLPNRARPLFYDIKKDNKNGTAKQEVSDNCHATFDVGLK